MNWASLSSLVSAGIAGFEELVGGVRHWRVWHLLGSRELRHRYARSRLGQFWVMVSVAITISAMAAISSLLWNQPAHEVAPFAGLGFILWTFMSHVATECTQVFSAHSNLYHNQKMNFSISIYSVIYKNALILAHNFIIIVALIVIFSVPVNWYTLEIVPALFVTVVAMTWSGYFIALICVRYRDVIQIINNWLF